MLRHSLVNPDELDREEVRGRVEVLFAYWEKQVQEMYEIEKHTGMLDGVKRLAERLKQKRPSVSVRNSYKIYD